MSSPSSASNAETAGITRVDHTALLISSLPTLPTKQPPSRLLHYTERAAFIAMAIFSVVVALFSYRYLIPQARVTLSPPVLQNFFARPFLYIHAAAAATALLTGPFQFIPSLRRTHLPLHRIMGRVYVLGCLIGGGAALPLSLTSTAGPVAQAGFFVLGLLWLVVNGNAWRLAVMGRIAEHKRWMIRSFALTYGAVTLRMIIFVLPHVFGVPFETAYVISAWASWVPNLLVVEAWMWYHSRQAVMVDVKAVAPAELVTTRVNNAESLLGSNEGL